MRAPRRSRAEFVASRQPARARLFGVVGLFIAVLSLHGVSPLPHTCHAESRSHGTTSAHLHDLSTVETPAGRSSDQDEKDSVPVDCATVPCAVAVLTTAAPVAAPPELDSTVTAGAWALTSAARGPEPPVPKAVLHI